MVTCTVTIGVFEQGTLAALHIAAPHLTTLALHVTAPHLATLVLHVTASHLAALHVVLSPRHSLAGIVTDAVAVFVDEVGAGGVSVGILAAWAEGLSC
jgi:hypothetical protein